MAALGDERLFALLERDGDGDRPRRRGGVRRAAPSPSWSSGRAWAKVEVVDADEKEQGAADGPDHAEPGPFARPRGRGGRRVRRACSTARRSRTGCAAAVRIGARARRDAAGAGGADRGAADAARARDGAAPLPARRPSSARSATDKKHAGGALRWVLPTADGSVVRSDVPADVVERAAASLLAPAGRPRRPRA